MKYALILSALLLGACSGQLRRPICLTSLTTLPADLTGVYEIVMPSPSVAWSSQVILKTVQVDLSPNSVMSSALLSRASEQKLCVIDGRYILEKVNANGTYAVSEFSKFSQGLVISTLTVDLDQAVAKGYKIHYLPKADRVVQDPSNHAPIFTGFGDGGSSFILDNTGLTPTQVLATMKPISFQMVMRSLPTRTKFKVKDRFRLTPEGLRR